MSDAARATERASERASDQQCLSVPNLLQEFLDAVEVVVRNCVSLEVHDHFLSAK